MATSGAIPAEVIYITAKLSFYRRVQLWKLQAYWIASF